MSKEILMQFVGFESKATAREYTFIVREASTEPREFTIAIAHEAFNAHRIRFQDGPNVCSLKLRRELTTYGNNPPESRLHVTDADLNDYRNSHVSPNRSIVHRDPNQGIEKRKA